MNLNTFCNLCVSEVRYLKISSHWITYMVSTEPCFFMTSNSPLSGTRRAWRHVRRPAQTLRGLWSCLIVRWFSMPCLELTRVLWMACWSSCRAGTRDWRTRSSEVKHNVNQQHKVTCMANEYKISQYGLWVYKLRRFGGVVRVGTGQKREAGSVEKAESTQKTGSV